MSHNQEGSVSLPVCPVCAGHDPRVEGKSEGYSLLTCGACGLGYADPMRESPDFYTNDLDYQIRDQLIVDPLQWEPRWDIRQFMEDPPARGGVLLDVGCGTGFFVKRAMAMGFDAHGVETDERAVRSGSRYFNLETLYSGTLSDFIVENPGRRFSIVTMFQVIEHLENPVGVLKQVRGVLEPDGILVLALPWKDRWPEILGTSDLPPHHLTRWTEKALHAALEQSGFKMRRIAFEKFPLWNMTGPIYRMIQKFIPSLTSAESIRADEGHDEGHGSHKQALKLLRKRKVKIRLALAASAPIWGILKMLGARGPHMYVEAVRSETL